MEILKIVVHPRVLNWPSSTVITGLLKNSLIIEFSKNDQKYEMFFKDKHKIYTKFIFNKLRKTVEFIKSEGFYYRFVDNKKNEYIKLILRNAREDIEMEYGSFFPPKIFMQHKYFDKFISFVENIPIEDLEPDPFCG